MSTKLKQHFKVLTVLLSGKPVTKTEFAETLGSEIELYRLSTYMWKIGKMGGKIEAIRDGKEVTAYRLTNPEAFKDVDLTVKAAAPKAVKPAKAKAPKKAQAPKKAKVAKPAKAKKAVKAVGVKAATDQTAVAARVTAKLKARSTTAPGTAIPEVLPLGSVAVDADFDAPSPSDLPDFLK